MVSAKKILLFPLALALIGEREKYFKTKTTNKIKKINHSSKKIPHLYMANQSEFENSLPYDTNLKKRSQLKTIDNRNKNNK